MSSQFCSPRFTYNKSNANLIIHRLKYILTLFFLTVISCNALSLSIGRDYLEKFSLCDMSSPGVIISNDEYFLLVRIESTNEIERTKVGLGIGRNYGRIESISQTEFVVTEMVRKPTDKMKWMEVTSTFKINEKPFRPCNNLDQNKSVYWYIGEPN